MSFISSVIGTAERVPLPDLVIRGAIQRLCSRMAARLQSLLAWQRIRWVERSRG
jgi:cyclopropane-fatty-acyl-phospholipid synthase